MSASQHPLAEVPESALQGPTCDHIAVAARGDFVVILFPSPVTWFAMNPSQAMQVGESIARSGYAVEAREDVYGHKPIIWEQIRERLKVKIEHLLKSDMVNDKLTNPSLTANRCVELLLTEVQ